MLKPKSKPTLNLQPSEAVVAQAAGAIYAAYIAAGRVPDGKAEEFMQRSIQEAFQIAKMTDEAIQSDTELD